MKYKLINKQTGEETLCDKITIDGFDYYVDTGRIAKPHEKFINELISPEQYLLKPIIATTNNSNIDIPKVVDGVEKMSWDMVNQMTKLKGHYERIAASWGFRNGYNKSQETHPFSEEDMIEFAKWLRQEDTEANAEKYVNFTDADMLQHWKEQKPKIVYYE